MDAVSIDHLRREQDRLQESLDSLHGELSELRQERDDQVTLLWQKRDEAAMEASTERGSGGMLKRRAPTSSRRCKPCKMRSACTSATPVSFNG